MTQLRGLHHFNKTAGCSTQSVNTCSFFGGKLVFHPENESGVGRCRKEGWEALRKVVWTVFNMLSSFYKYRDLYIRRDSSLKTGEKCCCNVVFDLHSCPVD